MVCIILAAVLLIMVSLATPPYRGSAGERPRASAVIGLPRARMTGAGVGRSRNTSTVASIILGQSGNRNKIESFN